MQVPRTVRVGLIDDSMLIRTVLKDKLEQDGKIKVVALGKSLEDAKRIAQRGGFDILILDVVLPDGKGTELARELGKAKEFPIILMSSLDKRELRDALELVLEHPLIEFVAKAPQAGQGFDSVVKDIRTKALAFMAFRALARKPLQKDQNKMKPVQREVKKLSATGLANRIVIIGSSTGGPKAIFTILSQLKPPFPPIVIIQHMPVGFTQSFADRLNQKLPIRIKEARDEEPIRPNTVYIAPSGLHLLIQKNSSGGFSRYVFKLDDSPPRNFVRPSVDVTLESAAPLFRQGLIAVILTGMGRDGQEGCKKVKEFGGKVIAEDRSTAIIYGMPKAVSDAGLADLVVPLYEVTETINLLLIQPYPESDN